MGASTPTTITRDLIAEIHELRSERRAAILAHNYQRPEIQDLADVVADSLKMARRATEFDAPVLVICGVHFMAETAAIANPDKRVLIPDLGRFNLPVVATGHGRINSRSSPAWAVVLAFMLPSTV